MILLLSVLFIGLFIGFLLRKNKNIDKPIDIIIMISIYGLLFFIGISVGSNDLIINNLAKIGLNAFILTLAAVIGTIALSIPVYKKFFVNNKNQKDIK